MKNICKTKLLARSGFTLAETTIVMGVIGIILAGVWGIVQTGWENQKRQQASDSMTIVVNNMRGFYAGQLGAPYSSNSLATTLLTNGVIPSSMQRNPSSTCTAAPCADNPWGSHGGDTQGTFRVCNWLPGTSSACPNGSTTGTTNFFGIELSGLTQSSCIAMTERVTSPLAPTGLVDVVIIGSATNDLGSAQAAVATAKTDCNAAGNGNALIFVYQLISGN